MSEPVKAGQTWRHREHGWEADVDYVGYLPLPSAPNESEWAVRFCSEFGIGQLREDVFVSAFEKASDADE